MADSELRSQWISREKLKCSFLKNKKVIGIGFLVLFVIVASIVVGTSVGLTHKKKSSKKSASFDENYNVSWSGDHIKVLNEGLVADVSLDKSSGAEFGSKNSYLFGHLSMQIKLVANDSAGTVTAYYMASRTSNRDEFDFEFLGNRSGQPYALQTNIYVNGSGGREERILLWYDPTTDYHTYSVLWNQYQIVFFVDDTPIRVFRNNSAMGVAYAFSQPMRIFGSMWNGEEWATVGGLEKTNWKFAPFVASFRDFSIDGCISSSSNNCTSASNWWDDRKYHYLELDQLDKLNWVKTKYTIYDYCVDTKRYSPLPVECGLNP